MDKNNLFTDEDKMYMDCEHRGKRLGDIPLGFWRYYLNHYMPKFKAIHPGLYRYAKGKTTKPLRGFLKNHKPLEGDQDE